MNGSKVKSAVEHLSSLLVHYTTIDLDMVSRGEIASTIKSLEKFQKEHKRDDELYILRGLLSSTISHLYIARGHATPDIPRHFDYYQSMNLARGLIEQIISLDDD